MFENTEIFDGIPHISRSTWPWDAGTNRIRLFCSLSPVIPPLLISHHVHRQALMPFHPPITCDVKMNKGQYGSPGGWVGPTAVHQRESVLSPLIFVIRTGTN
uniref:Uncharacterized protein n=1 Tax=Pseudonaja textilis TaxID=8673 RepID=A0A670Z5J4_PSETE